MSWSWFSIPHYDWSNGGYVDVHADLMWKCYDYNLKLEQAMRNQTYVVISKSCLWWFHSYWGGLKLRKLVINNWVHVSPRLFSKDWGGWWAIEIACTCLGDFFFDHWKNNFFINNWKVLMTKKWGGNREGRIYIEIWGNAVRVLRVGFCENLVGLSMCDGPIETVKYIWINIWCMLDWILSQNCRNTRPLHTADQLVGSAKT